MPHTALSPSSATGLSVVAEAAGGARAGGAGQARSGSRQPSRRDHPPPPDAALWRAWFGSPGLAASEQQALWSIADVRLVAAGSPVFGHDETARALLLLLRGDVALGWRSQDGVFHVERPVHAPAWLDGASAWVDARHAMDAHATSESVIVEWPVEGLVPILHRHPALAVQLIVQLAREVRALASTTHELMHKDAPARFAAWLLQRCGPSVGVAGGAVVQLTERKRDIASQLAITPETLSRLMRSFSRQGVVTVAGYTVHVLDVARLRELAQPG